MLDDCCSAGALLSKACNVIGLTPRTVQRWRQQGTVTPDGRKAAAKNRTPANKLTEQERKMVLSVINEPRFASLSPSQIVPKLADEGNYLASESTMYRVLREEKQLAHRGKAKPATHSRPPELLATAPNQLWSWDITYLGTTVKGIYFFLYMIMDLFSRKIVGWEIFDEQTAEHASTVAQKAYLREGIAGKLLRLHSDNGSPMKGATMLATLQRLGVMPSFSRPSVSNDNPYSEALFKTVKYHRSFPGQPFDTVGQARQWTAKFVDWYNTQHQHSAIKFVTPVQRHSGDDREILQQRKKLYAAAKINRPERWSGNCRNWERPEVVTLNYEQAAKEQLLLRANE